MSLPKFMRRTLLTRLIIVCAFMYTNHNIMANNDFPLMKESSQREVVGLKTSNTDAYVAHIFQYLRRGKPSYFYSVRPVYADIPDWS